MKAQYAKRIGFLTKREDMTKEQFVQHWRTVHAELCKKIPGLKRYAINFIDRDVYPNAGYDGFSELWFESKEAHDASLSSPEGKTLLADLPNFTSTICGVVAYEERFIWPADDGLGSEARLNSGR